MKNYIFILGIASLLSTVSMAAPGIDAAEQVTPVQQLTEEQAATPAPSSPCCTVDTSTVQQRLKELMANPGQKIRVTGIDCKQKWYARFVYTANAQKIPYSENLYVTTVGNNPCNTCNTCKIDTVPHNSCCTPIVSCCSPEGSTVISSKEITYKQCFFVMTGTGCFVGNVELSTCVC